MVSSVCVLVSTIKHIVLVVQKMVTPPATPVRRSDKKRAAAQPVDSGGSKKREWTPEDIHWEKEEHRDEVLAHGMPGQVCISPGTKEVLHRELREMRMMQRRAEQEQSLAD